MLFLALDDEEEEEEKENFVVETRGNGECERKTRERSETIS